MPVQDRTLAWLTLLKQLRDAQHPDGGWSWLNDTGSSNAYSTSQTLCTPPIGCALRGR